MIRKEIQQLLKNYSLSAEIEAKADSVLIAFSKPSESRVSNCFLNSSGFDSADNDVESDNVNPAITTATDTADQFFVLVKFVMMYPYSVSF